LGAETYLQLFALLAGDQPTTGLFVEDFVVRVRVAMVKSWPCRRKKDPDRVTQAVSGGQH
jgi:hypothetical protein